jgi:Ala-tRNA(Pro) deacylase
MNGDPKLYSLLNELHISFDYYEHPPAPTVEIASQYWKDIDAAHCKNLFFRNHKGNRHYLVILHYHYVLNIRDLEQRLKQGKLTFASEKRMKDHLGLQPGSVSAFGLINDQQNHVHLFIDENLRKYERISFHPNLNTASIVILFKDFIKYLDWTGNTYDFLKLYE